MNAHAKLVTQLVCISKTSSLEKNPYVSKEKVTLYSQACVVHLGKLHQYQSDCI